MAATGNGGRQKRLGKDDYEERITMGTKKRKHRQAVIEGKELPFKERPKCPVPGCGSFLAAGRSPNGLCPYHEGFLQALAYMLQRFRSGPQQTSSGLVLPGQPGYVMPEEVIRAEMEKYGRLKP